MFAAGTDFSLALAAIPPAMAVIVVGWLTYRATRQATPAISEAAAVAPRLDSVEDRAPGWLAAMAAKDALIAHLQAELAECRGTHPHAPPVAD